ncbi:hypothetical protein CHLRE_06g280750v5 [Chlamydomonas reinhardtii]|uniref:Uncharacterized protein n=1 Tax=Chlamydomonas reinhardtii TaxID=3055 RepID=A0A2K3DPM1_CHLRE|nr:uncharacterized protein CHLRE_06g280750v5 [Chlamydomonas reinhardtii]PNW82483.1 hypothetical protein CHLRE_06g280750v5 [Chlamydomonas reinhardtii]
MKELKPPPEMVEAIQQSEDMTAPPEFADRSDVVGHEPHHAHHEAAQGETYRMTKQELKDKKEEIKMMQYDKERHNRYDRNHPGGGPAGQGDAATTHSMMASRGEPGGHVRYGHD